MGHRERQLGENESMFRDVNETVAGATTQRGRGDVLFLCECADDFCAESVSLSLDAYEAVRAWPRRFVVKPGHVHPDVERVVSRSATYWVVEKLGEAGDVAREHAG
jgi:hypothetical protein